MDGRSRLDRYQNLNTNSTNTNNSNQNDYAYNNSNTDPYRTSVNQSTNQGRSFGSDTSSFSMGSTSNYNTSNYDQLLSEHESFLRELDKGLPTSNQSRVSSFNDMQPNSTNTSPYNYNKPVTPVNSFTPNSTFNPYANSTNGFNTSPVNPQPSYNQPTYNQSPVNPQPSYSQPTISQSPVNSQPNYNQTGFNSNPVNPQPSYNQTGFNPNQVNPQPSYSQPTISQSPVNSQPNYNQTGFNSNPVNPQPSYSQAEFNPNPVNPQPSITKPEFTPEPVISQPSYNQAGFNPNPVNPQPSITKPEFIPEPVNPQPSIIQPEFTPKTVNPQLVSPNTSRVNESISVPPVKPVENITENYIPVRPVVTPINNVNVRPVDQSRTPSSSIVYGDNYVKPQQTTVTPQVNNDNDIADLDDLINHQEIQVEIPPQIKEDVSKTPTNLDSSDDNQVFDFIDSIIGDVNSIDKPVNTQPKVETSNSFSSSPFMVDDDEDYQLFSDDTNSNAGIDSNDGIDDITKAISQMDFSDYNFSDQPASKDVNPVNVEPKPQYEPKNDIPQPVFYDDPKDVQELTSKLNSERVMREEMLQQTKQLKLQMSEYENELNEANSSMGKTNKILNFVLTLLIMTLFVILFVIGFWFAQERGLI